LLAVLKKIEQSGKRETASRMRSFASRVFRYAVATARPSNDPAQMLIGALVPPKVRHHAANTRAPDTIRRTSARFITNPVAITDGLDARRCAPAGYGDLTSPWRVP